MVSAAFKSTCPVEGTRRIGVDAPYGWGSPVEPTSGRGGGTPAGVTSTVVVTVSHITTRRAHRPRCAANAIQTPQAFHRFPETAEEMTTHSHRRRQSIFLIDAALRAAATLFSIVTQDGQRRIFQRSQPTAPKRRIGLPRSVGEAGGTLPVRWVHTPNKSCRYDGSTHPIKAAFLWGATPVSLGKGQRNGVAFLHPAYRWN